MPRRKKQKDDKMPRVSPELKGFDIYINSFGEIISNYDIDEINKFLNKNTSDKKLKHLNFKEEEEKGNENPIQSEENEPLNN